MSKREDSSTSKERMIKKRLKIEDDPKTKMKKMVLAINSDPLKNKIDDTKLNISYLENLPNEILLKIFHYMNPKIKELLLCGHVSRRIRSVAHDHSFWQNVNLFPKNAVPTGLLQLILENGCKRLNTCSQIVGTLTLNQESQLEFLNTAWNTDSRVLTVLLTSCHSLEFLRLSNVILNHDMISSICQNGQTLKELKLTNCKKFSDGGSTLEWIQPIIDNCSELSLLDLGDTPLSEESIEYLAKTVTPKISKLRMRGIISSITKYEQIIKLLTSRCKNLIRNLTELQICRSGRMMYDIQTIQTTEKFKIMSKQHDWESLIDIIPTFRRYE